MEVIEEKIYTVRIFDLHGRQLDQFRFEGIDYQYLFKNDLVDGIYILEIRDEEEVLYKNKFILL